MRLIIDKWQAFQNFNKFKIGYVILQICEFELELQNAPYNCYMTSISDFQVQKSSGVCDGSVPG